MDSTARRRISLIYKMIVCIIGILAIVHFLPHELVSQHLHESDVRASENGAPKYVNPSHTTSRRLLSEVQSTGNNFVDNSQSPLLRTKRESTHHGSAKYASNEGTNINHSLQTHSNIFNEKDSERLEWKIDVHVARLTSRSDKPEITEQSADHFGKTSRDAIEAERVGVLNDDTDNIISDDSLGIKLSDDSLGIKLSVEGRGGNSSYTDLQKAWASVGLFLKHLFEDSIDPNLENSRDGENVFDGKVIPHQIDSRFEELPLKQSKRSEANHPFQTSDGQHTSSTGPHQDIMQESHEPFSESFHDSGAHIAEEDLLEVQSDKTAVQEIDDKLDFFSIYMNTDVPEEEMYKETELETRDPNSSEKHAKSRFLFDFFNRGSGDLANSPMKSDVDTSRREGRFIFGFFGSQSSPSSDVKETGSGYSQDDNVVQRRVSRVHLYENTSNREQDRENDTTEEASDQSTAMKTNETDNHPSGKQGRFFFGVFNMGSGERALPDESDEYPTYLTPMAKISFDYNETASNADVNTPYGDNDYLDSHSEDYSVKMQVAKSQKEMNSSDYYGNFHEEVRQLETGMNNSEYSQEEIVSFQYARDDVKETTELTYSTEELNPRFFGDIFAIGSGESELFSVRKIDNDTHAISVVVNSRIFNENVREETLSTTEKPWETNSGTAHPFQVETTFLYTNNDKGKYTDKLKLEESDAFSSRKTATSTTHTASEITENTAEDIFAAHDLNFMDHHRMINESKNSRIFSVDYDAGDPTEVKENGAGNSSDKLTLEQVAFSSGDGEIPSGTPEAVRETSQRVRGARLLDDYYDCNDSECSGNSSRWNHEGTMSQDKITEGNMSTAVEEASTTKIEEMKQTFSTAKSSEEFLTMSTEAGTSFYGSTSTTSRSHRTRYCKAPWHCDEKLNERCVVSNGASICDCGRSFVRHPTTRRCEAKAMVEAIIRFADESYHKDLENPGSERYLRTKRAAQDTMKTLMQANPELSSTIADVEVVGFKPGSLIVIWNLIVPTEGNESLNSIMVKVDEGLKASLNSPTVLRKLPFKSFNVAVLEVHQAAIDQCKISSLNYCSENAICFRDATLTGGFRCKCKNGFLDLSENVNYPGEICHATCTLDYCGEHGVCEVAMEGTLKCNCQGWFLGEKCQISGVVMVGSASIAVILLLVVVIMICLLWRYKRSSGYGNDVEGRFHRAENYGSNRKSTKALGDVLPMEESTAVPSRFTYIGVTPNPPKLLGPAIPKITVTSPSASDMSSYFSDSTFDSMKS